jgi:hypothetical protein
VISLKTKNTIFEFCNFEFLIPLHHDYQKRRRKRRRRRGRGRRRRSGRDET